MQRWPRILVQRWAAGADPSGWWWRRPWSWRDGDTGPWKIDCDDPAEVESYVCQSRLRVSALRCGCDACARHWGFPSDAATLSRRRRPTPGAGDPSLTRALGALGAM